MWFDWLAYADLWYFIVRNNLELEFFWQVTFWFQYHYIATSYFGKKTISFKVPSFWSIKHCLFGYTIEMFITYYLITVLYLLLEATFLLFSLFVTRSYLNFSPLFGHFLLILFRLTQMSFVLKTQILYNSTVTPNNHLKKEIGFPR